MKVLHLFDIFLPATLGWTNRLMLELAPVEVSVAAPWIMQTPFFRPEFRYYRFPPQQWLFKEILRETDHSAWRKIFAGSQRFLSSYSWWLYSRLKRDKPDLLHAHFGPVGCLYLPLAKRLERPLVVTFYGFDYTKVPNLRPFYKEKYRELFAQAAQVIAASPVGRDLLVNMGCPAEKLSVLPPSIYLPDFPFRPEPKKPGFLKLVQVATFTPKKGHLDTLEAFRRALVNCPGLHLTLAGEKWDKQLVLRLEKFIQTHGLSGHIRWLDTIDPQDMGAFLRQFDVLIHPSCCAPDGDHEDTPVIILEAQASGKPVISTTHFAIPSQVLHGRSGFLAPEHDPAALAGYIERFYRMEDAEYQQFSLVAQAQVAEHFDVRKTAETLRGLYERLVNQ